MTSVPAINCGMKASICELTARNSSVHLSSDKSSHDVSIFNSEFYFSILSIIDVKADLVFTDHTVTNALIFESNLMQDSLVTITLQNPFVYILFI